ncbi:MAG TPA: toll/interleukin-1 receptor domain-containing protein, partial [Rhodanobacter sp.]|nr:toll/interleukin-1 receptor domain-containing protein [Rhodanobacter sp.]
MSGTVGPQDFRYRAFISYSHQDKAWADWLHKALETYAVPKRLVGMTTDAGVIPQRLTPIFRDRDELASAHDLGRKVNAALAQSANLIVICSPRSAGSHWVNEEILAYKRRGRSERIFCLIVDGEPNASDLPGREAEECFAAALRFQLDGDGQLSSQLAEPIAADARNDKDGKGNAKLKLIAGLLDVGFDALKQRELKRRARRMSALAALAVAVMTLTTTLAIFALVARHAAVRRQKQAENLVGFMLGDLNDKLAQVQRLDIMQAVDDKAMAYFASLPTNDVTDKALAARAKALEKIGTVRGGQGHLKGSLEAYEASAKIAATLADAAPTDAARQLAYARTLTFIGTNHWYQGQLEAAQKSYQAAQDVLARASHLAVNDRELQFELEMIDNNIGHVLEARGQPDSAAALYRSALSLAKELVAADSNKIEWAVALGRAHNDMGKLALLNGDLGTAIREYRADDAIETELLSRDPRNNEQKDNMLTTRAILGRTLALAGDDANGTRDLQQAVDAASALMKIAPTNTDFQEYQAIYAVQLARMHRLDGNLPAAQSLIEHALGSLGELATKDPASAYFKQDLAEAMTEQGAESLAGELPERTRSEVESALAALAPLLAKQPHDRTLMLDLLSTQLLLAQVSTDPQARAKLLNNIVDTARMQQSGHNDPRLVALQVQALLGLGKEPETRQMVAQLEHGGYGDRDFVNLLS